jgi:hypothetical protein
LGLFLCDICDEQLSLEVHVCEPDKIRARIQKLQDATRIAEFRWDKVRNAVYMILQSLPLLGDEKVVIEAEWLRRLWDAADCRWYENTSADNFLVRWIAVHRILSEAFDVFRSKKNETLLVKLQALKKVCDEAKEVLGYQNSILDLMPEDLIEK